MTKKICLIDGSGYIFRAFYALPILTSPQGTPVNALLGFINMFMRLRSKIECDYCLVLFDAKRQNFRNDIFPDYKGTRKETPEELIPQFPLIRQAVDVLNLSFLEMEGYEADDLIATYADLALKQNFEVVVVSADKDLMQLIRPGVQYYDGMKDKFFTPEDVKEKFGVLPEKVVDVQALSGDSIDNVPGVPGIGPKTAAELINRFGSLEEVLSRASEIKQNKRRETLIENTQNALISKKLVTLKSDVPVNEPLESFRCKAPQKEKVLSFIDEYGLKSLRARAEKWIDEQSILFGKAPSAPTKEIQKQYSLIQDEAALKNFIEKIKKARLFAIDTETTGLNPFKDTIVGFSLSYDDGKACYVPLKHGEQKSSADLFAVSDLPKQISFETAKKLLKPLLEDPSILKIGHNIKFDMHFLKQITGNDTNIFPYDDTAVMSYVLDSLEHGHGMDELAQIFLNYETIKYEDVCGSGKNKITFNQVELEKALDYAAEDADITLRLYKKFKPRLIAENKIALYENFDRPLVSVLQKMEQRGILVDALNLSTLDAEFEKQMQNIEQEIYALAGEQFNLASPKQIGDILYVKMGLKGKKTATGAFQTGADVLEDLAQEHELPKKILEWRAFQKLKSTYTGALLEQRDKNGRIHTTFSQTVVNTGRLASSNPNLQNIPIRTEEGQKIRRAFIAPKGYKIISADYSQVELRLLAAVADVKALKEAFLNGVDIHALTASRVFHIPLDKVDSSTRRNAKAINFGIVYGISQYGLARQLNISTDEAKQYIDSYFAAMPEIKQYMAKTIEFAHHNGYVLTPYGRKCSTQGINDQNKRIVSFAERAAINAPIQGGASDIIKLAMKQVDYRLAQGGFKTKMLLQVHDELIFEAPDDEVETVKKLIKETMENVVSFDIPFIAEVGVGENWRDAH